jgi:tRNA dimethylallyltransferase
LIDILEPDEVHSAGRHCEMVREVVASIQARGAVPFLVGGTGLYFRALFEGLIETSVPDKAKKQARRRLEGLDTAALYEDLRRIDPLRAKQLSPNDRARIVRAMEIFLTTGRTASAHAASQPPPTPWDGPRFVLTAPRDELRRRIAERTKIMYEQGWVEEVRALIAMGVDIDAPAMNSLGYARIAQAMRKGEDPRETLGMVTTETQQYAKRQETFFRSIAGAVWIDICAENARGLIEKAIRSWARL